jgi:hypothetical protein
MKTLERSGNWLVATPTPDNNTWFTAWNPITETLEEAV